MSPMVIGIVKEVCAERSLKFESVVGRSRLAPFARARHEVWRRLRNLGWSLPAIASEFGVDHTTVLSGSRKAAERSGRPLEAALVRVHVGPRVRIEYVDEGDAFLSDLDHGLKA